MHDDEEAEKDHDAVENDISMVEQSVHGTAELSNSNEPKGHIALSGEVEVLYEVEQANITKPSEESNQVKLMSYPEQSLY